MRFRYWTVRVVPSPFAITSIGFGVIVQNPNNGEALWKFHDDYRGMYGIGNAVKSAKRQLTNRLKGLQESGLMLDIRGSETLPDYLSWCSNHWNNLLRVDHEKSVLSDSLANACDLLFQEFITPERQKQHGITVSSLRAQVKETYQRLPTLKNAVRTGSSVQFSGYKLQPNCAVVRDDVVFEFNDAFNFETENSETAFTRAENWALRIDKLRHTNAFLVSNDTKLTIDDDTEILAFYQSPPREEQFKALERAQKIWRQLGVLDIPIEQAPNRAAELQLKLAA